MRDTLYQKSFSLFLKRTNEKAVVGRFVQENIALRKDMDFLDVGGGSGSLATTISKRVKTTVVVEPNREFYKKLIKYKNIKIINDKWEDACLSCNFDFILAAYVVTYLTPTKRRQLIKKMYNLLRPKGILLILTVDAKRGSWRGVHMYFNKLRKYKHESSDSQLKEIVRNYKTVMRSFKTKIVAKSISEMMYILSFDFSKYPEHFSKFSAHLKKFLSKYSDRNGGVTLEIVHNAYIITKI